MEEKAKIPIVTYWVDRGGQREFGFGYLVRLANGQWWCLPDEETAEKQSSLAGGFQIDQSHLQEQPDTGADRKLYLCKVVVSR
jgi:hypothetical protein